MRTTDLFKNNRSAKKLNESLQKTFGKHIDLKSMDLPRLEDARNKLRTQVHDARSQGGFNENLENETLTQAQWMLDAINAEIIEREEFIADPHVAEISEEGDEDSNYAKVIEYTKQYMIANQIETLASEDVDAIATELGLSMEDVLDCLHDVGLDPQDEVEEGSDASSELSRIVSAGDYDGLYGLMSSNSPAGRIVQDMYNSVASEHHLHPDDSFEEILDIVMDQLEADYGYNDEGGETDDNYALASAGFGSDEDYGSYGEGFGDNAKPGDTFKTRTGTATKTKGGVVHRAE